MSLLVYPNQIFGISPNIVKTPEFRTLAPESPAGIGPRIAQTRNPMWHFQLAYEQLYNFAPATAGANPTNTNYTKSELEAMLGFNLLNQGQLGEFLLDDPEDDTATAQTLQLIEDTSQPISAAAVASGGSGFSVGDQLAVIGGGGTGAIVQVATLSGSAIATLSVIAGGSGYTTTSGVALQPITGSGTGSPTANITAAPIWYSPLQRTIGDPAVGQFQEDITDLNPQDFSGLVVKANGVTQAQATSNLCGAGGNFEIHGPGLAIPGYSFMGLYLKWCAAPTAPITASFQWYFRVRFEQDKTDFERFLYRLWTIGGENMKRGGNVVKLVTARPLFV